MSHVLESHRPVLQAAIKAVTETKAMLGEVAERFGTTDPEVLRARIGQTCGDTTIDETTVAALVALLVLHEERREACLCAMADAAHGRAPHPPAIGGAQ